LKDNNISLEENALYAFDDGSLKYEYESRFMMTFEGLNQNNQISIVIEKYARVTMGGISHFVYYAPLIKSQSHSTQKLQYIEYS
jgi:hypothetical protein